MQQDPRPDSPNPEQEAEEVVVDGEAGATEEQAEEQAPEEAEADPRDARIAELENQLDLHKRALADRENVARRAEQEVAKARKFGVQDFAKDMLSVGDNLARALAAVPAEAREQDEAVKNLMLGVEMTERELLTALGRYGVVPVPALDQPFDPNVHQAMMELEDPSKPAGTVVQVMQEGYMIHDRLLRPAMVGVSKGGPKRDPNQGPVDEQA